MKSKIKSFSLVKCSNIDDVALKINKLFNKIKFEVNKYDNISILDKIEKTIKNTYEYCILIKLNSIWNIVFDDQLNSDGCASILYNLNRTNGFEGLTMISNELGISFTYYRNKSKRVINAYYENNKWTFFQKGEFLEFENPDYYSKRIIKNRFNYEIFLEYLKKLQINNYENLLNHSNEIYIMKKTFTIES